MDAFDETPKGRASDPRRLPTTFGNVQPGGSPMINNTPNGTATNGANGYGTQPHMYMPTFGSMDPFLPTGSPSQKMNVGANPFKPALPATAVKPKPISFLNYGSTSDDKPLIVSSPAPIKTKGLAKVTSALPTPIGTMSPGYSPTEKPELAEFTTDCAKGGRWIGTHYLTLKNIDPADFQAAGSAAAVEMMGLKDKVLEHKACNVGNTNKLVWHMRFDDLDDVPEALDLLQAVDSKWAVELASQSDFVNAIGTTHNASNVKQASCMFEAQVRLSATFTGFSKDAMNINAVELRNTIRDFANGFGKLIAFQMLDDAVHPFFEFRVEFKKITSARKLIEACSPIPKAVGEFKLAAVVFKTDAYEPASASSPAVASMTANMNGLALTPTNTQIQLHSVPQISPSGRSQWITDAEGNTTLLPPPRVVPTQARPYSTPHRAVSMPQQFVPMYTPNQCMDPYGMSPDYRSPAPRSHRQPRRDQQNQDVTMQKLEAGLDTRTTLMLRNMPNGLKADGFKALLDAAVPGKYDFSYLRIDFSQDKNVGYGFVNFSRCDSIKDFVAHYEGRPWSMSSPRKISDYSYATIQGLEGLIEKFRNSAIMDEYPQHRPKLWFTEDNLPSPDMVYLIGQEKEMPGPNNMSKKQRSLDNAGQIGLFPPKTNSITRDGRQFRGRFDRGTTRQQREEERFFQLSTPPPLVMQGYPQQYSPLQFHQMGPFAAMPPQGMHYNSPASGSSPSSVQGSFFANEVQPGYVAQPMTPSTRFQSNFQQSMSAPRSMVQLPTQQVPRSAPPMPVQRSASGIAQFSPTNPGSPFAAYVSSPLRENWDESTFALK